MTTTKTAAIAALTVIGGASIGTGVVVAKGSVGMPYYHFLFEDEGYNDKIKESGDYKSKYGEVYGRYLVGVTDSKVKTHSKSNDRWWTWSFYNRYTPNISEIKDKFSEVNSPEELKGKCTEAYKVSSDGGMTINLSDSDLQNKFLESNIWLFCSPAEEKIKSVFDENKANNEYTATSIYGNDDATKKDLVSVLSESKGNDWFWNLQRDKYKYENPKSKAKGGLQISDNDVKGWCRQAYKRKDTDDAFSEENVFKWCSLSGTSAHK